MRSLVEELADRELSSWRRGSEVRTWERMQQLTLDAVLVAVFGMPERSPLRELLLELNRVARSPLQLARLSVLRRDLAAPPHPRSRLGRLLARIDRELYARIASRQRGPDVLSMLAATEMTPRELRDELLTMLLAGWETTAASLAWAFERLSRNPGAWRFGEAAIVQETLPVRSVAVRFTATTVHLDPVRRRAPAVHRRGVRGDGDGGRALARQGASLRARGP